MSLASPQVNAEAIQEVNGDTPLVTLQQRVVIPQNTQAATLTVPLPPFAQFIWASLSNVTQLSYNTATISTNVAAASNVSNTTVSRCALISHSTPNPLGAGTASTAANTNNFIFYFGTATASSSLNFNGLPNQAATSAINSNSTEQWLSLIPVATAGNTPQAIGNTTDVGFRFNTTTTDQIVNLRVVYRQFKPSPTT